ncbi:hypothetical protein RZN22_15560 [Bacillaceae bacterium S4-13-58]
MRKIGMLFLGIVLLLAACGTSGNTNSDGISANGTNGDFNNAADITDIVAEYEVQQTSDEVTEGDFIFHLVSEKDEYKEGEEVEMYGEIEYIGEKDKIDIFHSSSAIFFHLKEEVRGYDIGYAVEDIGLTTTLKKGEPYREDFQKSGGYSENQDPKDYVDFMKKLFDMEGLPVGYYTVKGQTDFYVKGESEDELGEKIQLQSEIDFKVIE